MHSGGLARHPPCPAAAAVAAPGGAVAAGLVGAPRSARMPRQAVHVAGRLGSMIAERGAAVPGAHQPAELDAHQHHLGIVRARCDPAHVRGPGPGRIAPVRPRRDLLKRHQLLPTLAAVATSEQPARLRPRVHGAVRRAHRDAEHVALRQRHVLEAVAAVRAALQAASPTADVHRVAVERQALRPRTLQARVRTEPHERVTSRRKKLHPPQDRASRPRARGQVTVRCELRSVSSVVPSPWRGLPDPAATRVRIGL